MNYNGKEQFQTCVFKAYGSKSAKNRKEQLKLAFKIIKKTFNPLVNPKKLVNASFDPWKNVKNLLVECYLENLDIDDYINKQYKDEDVDIIGLLSTSRPVFKKCKISYNTYRKAVKAISENWEEMINYEDNPYMYVVVRDDIPDITKAVQACHAVEIVSNSFDKLCGYQYEVPYMILLGTKNENELKKLYRKLSEYIGCVSKEFDVEDVNLEFFHEPDMNDEWTAFALSPVYESCIRKFFRQEKLLTMKGNENV